ARDPSGPTTSRVRRSWVLPEVPAPCEIGDSAVRVRGMCTSGSAARDSNGLGPTMTVTGSPRQVCRSVRRWRGRAWRRGMRTRRRRGGVLVSPGGLPAGLPVDAGERGDVDGVALAQLTELGERLLVGEFGGEPVDLFRRVPGQRPRDLQLLRGGGDDLRKACPR